MHQVSGTHQVHVAQQAQVLGQPSAFVQHPQKDRTDGGFLADDRLEKAALDYRQQRVELAAGVGSAPATEALGIRELDVLHQFIQIIVDLTIVHLAAQVVHALKPAAGCMRTGQMVSRRRVGAGGRRGRRRCHHRRRRQQIPREIREHRYM